MPVNGLARLNHFFLNWKAIGLLTLGQRGRAMAAFRELLVRWPDDVHALNSLGYDALQRSHPGEAHGFFKRVSHLAPETSNARFNEAFVCEALGLLDEAESGFRAAIAIEAGMDRAWYGLGLVLVRLGRLDEALEALGRNTTLQPMNPFGWYQMARVRMDLGQPEEARTIILHLKGFEPKVAAQLERETGLTSGHLI